MGKNNGVWKQHIPKRLAEKKRINDKIDDIIFGPREGQCGLTGYAGKTPYRYACHACGNYHDKPQPTGGLDDKADSARP